MLFIAVVPSGPFASFASFAAKKIVKSPAMSKPPRFLHGLVGSAVPLAVAILVASIAGLLVYIFWFGTDWIMEWLF